ncbi:MAG: hypothetical protein K6A15_06965 [Treponema sp.]|nr:hypothetical protein [Treponema sp.]
MAVPNRILEAIKNSELKANDFYSIYGKENIEASVEELKRSDMEILNTYSVQDMRKAVAEKLAGKNKESQKSSILKFPTYKIIGYAAAAVLLAAIMVPAGLKNSTAASRTPTERIKGNAAAIQNADPTLKLYRQQGREIQALNNGDFAHTGDVIQIAYNAGSSEYGVIFSVDGNGNITRHFPENSWQAAQLMHRADDTPLDFSYELDNAPDFECFIMVTSKKQFSLNGLESAIKNKTDIDYLTALSYLPKKTEGTTFILEK